MFRTTVLIVFVSVCTFLAPVFACAEFSFKGEVDFKNKDAEVLFFRRENESATLKIEQKSANKFVSVLDVKNLETKFFDIATILESSIEVKRSPQEMISAVLGEVVSKYTLINHKPVQEFQGYFDYKDDVLNFSHLSIGNVVCQGRLNLKFPMSLDLHFRFSDVVLSDALYFFTHDETIYASGFLAGEIKISGIWPHVEVTGNFKSEYGAVGALVYKRFNFDFQGAYPMLHIIDSNIIKEDGHIFKILGILDISERGSYSEQFAQLKMEPVIHQEGDNLEWTFKRIESEGNSGSTEIKYQIRTEDDVKTLSEENSDLLGIERKVQF